MELKFHELKLNKIRGFISTNHILSAQLVHVTEQISKKLGKFHGMWNEEAETNG